MHIAELFLSFGQNQPIGYGGPVFLGGQAPGVSKREKDEDVFVHCGLIIIEEAKPSSEL
jgi:hypothetical protein